MSPKYMERGRSQVLFTFLPGRTFDYEGGSMICRVTEFEFEENTRIDKQWLLRDLHKYLNGWRDKDSRDRLRGFPDPLKAPDSYALGEPTKVLFDVFPLTFQCRKCRRVVTYRTGDEAVRRGLTCPVCKGELGQIHHVQVHTCGHIEPLMPPRCDKHGWTNIVLDDRGSQAYVNFRWVCKACGDRELKDPLTRDCPECSGKPGAPKDQLRMRPAVHRAGSTYYPQIITLVDVPGESVNRLLQDPDYRYLIAAAYLGIVKPNEVQGLAQGEEGSGMDQAVATLEAMMATMSGEQRAAIEAQFGVMKEKLLSHGQGRRESAINQVKELIGDTDDEHAAALGKELVEFLRPGVDLAKRTVEELKAFARAQDLPERLIDYDQYPVEWSALGLAGVELIEDFPLATAAVGYTRVLREPQRETDRGTEKSVLRAFPLDKKNRTPIYVVTQDAEALSVQIRPDEVLRWLTINGLVSDAPDLDNPRAAKAWFLRNVRAVQAYDEIAATDPVTREVFGLVHSMSHLLLRQAVVFSGFDPQSLSEYLFPRALSFVIYANTLQGFSIGGLHTLFEQSLHKWLRDASEAGRMCVYDPICAERDSACHACLHISEVSCTHFNRWLGRRHLFGASRPDGTEYIGFWDARVRLNGGGGR